MIKYLSIFLSTIALILNNEHINIMNKFSDAVTKISDNVIVEDIPNVIIDLDFSSDVDDTCAVRIATELASQGKCNLLAAMLSTKVYDNANVKSLQGYLRYDGFENVPVGISRIDFLDGDGGYWGKFGVYSDYSQVSKDAVDLYTEILSNSNKKIRIITTGYLTNISELLKSDGGWELVRDNVEAIYITGGTYLVGWDNNFGVGAESGPAAKYVNTVCPCDIYYITNDNGAAFTCGGLLQKIDEYHEDPLTSALYSFGVEDGRAAWDPIATWFAIESQEVTKVDIIPIHSYIEDNGNNIFTPTDEETNRYIMHRGNIGIAYYKDTLDYMCAAKFIRSHPNNIRVQELNQELINSIVYY